MHNIKMYKHERPWWRESYKAKKKLTAEMVVRKSIKETFLEKVNHSSSSYRNLVDPTVTKKEKFFWLLCHNVATVFCVCSLYFNLRDVFSCPLVVSMESTVYDIGNVDFPAVALCNVNRISKKAAKEFAKKIFPIGNYPLDTIEEYVYRLGRLIDYEMQDNEELINFFSQVPQNENSNIWVNLMLDLAPNCSEMLVRCHWGGHPFACDKLFDVRRTSRGHCCAFNYILDHNNAARPRRLPRDTQRQTVPGIAYGLNVIMDFQLEDYAYPLHNIEGVDVLLFEPDHYPDHSNGRLIHRIVPPNTAINLELHSRVQLATSEVRHYTAETTNCLFHDDLEEFGDAYSYSTCIIACRIRTLQSLCKCTPYFLPVPRNNSPVCTIAHLRCLNKYKGKLLFLYPISPETTEGLEMELQDSTFCPQCLPDCEHTQHVTRSSTIPLSGQDTGKYLPYAFFSGLNMTNKGVINIYHATPDTTLDRLDVVSYWFEIISNIGGTAGVLVGYSFISTMEWIYYIFFRFIAILCTNFAKNNKL